MACGGSSSQQVSQPPRPADDGTRQSLPSPEVYACRSSTRTERYWWQRPEQVVELLACEPGMTVADLGAGTGYFLPYLEDAVGRDGQVLALDADPKMFEMLERRVARSHLSNVTPVLVSADDPELAPRSVDRILGVNTWHHITERVAYAKKLARALVPGGRILIIEFDENSPKGPPAEMRLSPSEVISDLTAAGLEARALDEELPYQHAVVAMLEPS